MDVEMRSVDELRPYENNPRENDEAVGAVAASIREFGWRQPIVVDAEGVIVAGHTRWKAAKQLGLAKVPEAARDADDAKRLWSVAERLTGVRYG